MAAADSGAVEVEGVCGAGESRADGFGLRPVSWGMAGDGEFGVGDIAVSIDGFWLICLSRLADAVADFWSEFAELFDMVTVPLGVPSIRSGWLEGFKVIRRADPGGTEMFMPAKVKAAGEVEVFGKLIKMVFSPEELEP